MVINLNDHRKPNNTKEASYFFKFEEAAEAFVYFANKAFKDNPSIGEFDRKGNFVLVNVIVPGLEDCIIESSARWFEMGWFASRGV